jgi:hypothetical protein
MLVPRRWRSALGAAALGVAAQAVPASAQRAVVSHGPAFTPLVTQVIDLATGAVERTLPAPVIEPMFTADGRLVVFRPLGAGGVGPLQVLDVTTGAVVTLAVDFEPEVAHPREAALFGLARTPGATPPAATAARLDAGGITAFGGCPPGATGALDLSVDGRVLLLLCASGEVAALDAGTGTVLGTVAAGAHAEAIAAGVDDATFTVLRRPPDAAPVLATFDRATGAELAAVPFPVPGGLPPACSSNLNAVAADRRLLVVSCTWVHATVPLTFVARVHVYDTVARSWGAPLPVPWAPLAFVISPDNRVAVAASVHPRVALTTVQVIDLATLAPIATVPTVVQALAVAFPPLAPSLAHAVTGRAVDLSWTLPAHSPPPAGFVVEAGSAPGRRDLLTLRLGPTASLHVPAAPPGRYYVRLRARNVSGTGPASQEIVVDVP